ncbi:MAG: GlsB/YeaQ/YmgE family stress response membrane protein [Coriobacteriia bacterium]
MINRSGFQTAEFIGKTGVTGFNLQTLLVATLGALVVLFIYSLIRKK